MSKEIHIEDQTPGGTYFNYPRDGENVEGIIALEAIWFDRNQEGDTLLAAPPQGGTAYTVAVIGPMKFDETNDFWVFYEHPESHLNGLETQEEIDAIRFCQCTFLEELPENRIKIFVDDVISLNDSAIPTEPDDLPEIWKSFIQSTKGHSDRLLLGNLEILSLTLEGDVGLTLIAKHDLDQSRIVMVHDWDFSRNVIYKTNIRLNSEARTKGIRQSV